MIFCNVTISIVVESIGGFFLVNGQNNIPLFNAYHLVNITLLGLISIRILESNFFSKIVYIGLLLHAIIWTYSLVDSGINRFANVAFEFASILLVSIYLFLFLKINLLAEKKLESRSLSYFVMAVIIFFGCNIPGFGFMNYLTVHYREIGANIFIINNVLSTIYYILISYSFYRSFLVVKYNSIDAK